MDVEELLAGRATAPGKWTRIAKWHHDDANLIGVFDYEEPHAGTLLAYGLEQLGSRKLHLAVPGAAVEATRSRAAFLGADIAVLRRDGESVDPEQPVSRAEAQQWFGRLGPVTHIQGVEDFDWPSWLTDLIDWVETRRVERIHRSHAWSWHFRGRQILKLRQTTSGYELVAGVDYTKPTESKPAATVVTAAAGGPVDNEIIDVQTAIDRAIDNRRQGIDRDHREHLLQAAIGVEPALIGMNKLYREYPAWRPKIGVGAARGFIDFLGVDIDGGLHVIEAKIGPDPMLGIQGLDYWAWVTAHREEIADQLGVEQTDAPVGLHFVVACSEKSLVHNAAARTVDLLAPDIPWRFHVIRDWNTVDNPGTLVRPTVVRGIRRRTVPAANVCHADD